MPNTMIQCNHPGCQEHSIQPIGIVEWNCGRHVAAPQVETECKSLEEARELLREVLIDCRRRGTHAETCEGQIYANKNRHCPAGHPVWKYTPPCSCFLGRIANFLIKN